YSERLTPRQAPTTGVATRCHPRDPPRLARRIGGSTRVGEPETEGMPPVDPVADRVGRLASQLILNETEGKREMPVRFVPLPRTRDWPRSACGLPRRSRPCPATPSGGTTVSQPAKPRLIFQAAALVAFGLATAAAAARLRADDEQKPADGARP